MKGVHSDCLIRVILDLQVRHGACEILRVPANADQSELKKARQEASARHRVDQHQVDPDAHKKSILVECAYELLAEGKSRPALLEEIRSWDVVPEADECKLDNPWGLFLWWHNEFFGSPEGIESHERTCCI